MPGPHHYHKPDGNLDATVKALEGIGARVAKLNGAPGLPDLVVGWRGLSILLELKNGDKPLRKAQQDFVEAWPGAVCVAFSPQMAVEQVVAHWKKFGL